MVDGIGGTQKSSVEACKGRKSTYVTNASEYFTFCPNIYVEFVSKETIAETDKLLGHKMEACLRHCY
jgi:hypothetical protein